MRILLNWIKCPDGATAMEYSLIAAGVAIAIIAALFLTGESLETVFNTLADSLTEGVTQKL